MTITDIITYQTSAANPSQTATLSHTVTYTFNVKKPCLASNLNQSLLLPNPLEYTLGMTGAMYSFVFEYTADCILPISYTLSSSKLNMLSLNSAFSRLETTQSFDLT